MQFGKQLILFLSCRETKAPEILVICVCPIIPESFAHTHGFTVDPIRHGVKITGCLVIISCAVPAFCHALFTPRNSQEPVRIRGVHEFLKRLKDVVIYTLLFTLDADVEQEMAVMEKLYWVNMEESHASVRVHPPICDSKGVIRDSLPH